MGTIEITHDSLKTVMVFDKGDENRNEFMSQVRRAIHGQFFDRKNDELFHTLILMFREMVKNVCDHGNGRAVLTVTEHPDGIVEFAFVDGSETVVSFVEICDQVPSEKWKKKSPSNCGVGLGMILCGYKDLGIEQRIDDTNGGISYYGKYVPN